jgi:DNA-binding GntR family transcriptional regulator
MKKRTTIHSTSNNYAYDALRNEILSGRLLPGNWLREQDLVERLGISRTPIREAVRQLGTEGLVEIVPYRGARIFVPDIEDVRDEYTLRAALEGFAAELAIAHITDEDITELQVLTDEAERLLDQGSIASYLKVNRSFHMKLYGLSGSRRVLTMIEASWEKDNLYRRFFYAQPAGLEEEKACHRALLQACRLRDREQIRRVMQESCLKAVQLFSRDNEENNERIGIS